MVTMAASFAAKTSELSSWRRALVAWCAGAIAALAMPPLGMWPLLFVTFPVFLWLLDGAATASPRARFALGWLFGFGYFIVAFHWIAFAFLVDAETYLWMMPFAVGGLAGGMAIYWGLAALAATALWPRDVVRIIWLAACLAFAEWLRGHLLTGFPWAAPGLAAMGMGGLAQTASLIGMTGLTFLIALWATLPALVADMQRSRGETIAAMVIAVLLPLAWMWGEWRLDHASSADVAGVKLKIVQPDIPQDEKWREGNARAIFEKLMSLSMEDGITHVIWPESAVPFLVEESEGARTRIAEMLAGKGTLIMGALRREGRGSDANIFNSILVFDGQANVTAHYDKWRLVPGGEFLPFETVLEPLGFRKVVTVPGSFAAGPGPRTFAIPNAPDAGFLVCYEAIFPHQLVDPDRRPDWIINVTNDGWFGRSTGPWQHLAQARMRAIEQGLPIVRAANTGISAVIDAYGRLRSSLPLDTAATIVAPLPVSLAPTLYARFGDWFAAAFMLFGVLLNLVQLAAAKRAGERYRR
jgi:apolipoprotein N-acyltransferase